jgi:hypothetical protein
LTEGLSELELELRLLPGVVDVGFSPVEPTGRLAISLVALEPEEDLQREASRIARVYRGSATVEIVDLTPPRATTRATELPGGPDERVALLESSVEETGVAKVVLAWMGHASRATASAGTLIGPAQATLGALDGLGIDVDATLSSVSAGRGLENPPVRVILRSRHDETEFVGIARGRSESESAARATLAAVNRYLVGHRSVVA